MLFAKRKFIEAAMYQIDSLGKKAYKIHQIALYWMHSMLLELWRVYVSQFAVLYSVTNRIYLRNSS